MKRGVFITFEGTEGCGKTTHARMLYEFLAGRGMDCVCTREPGGTRAGELIRGVLLNSEGVEIDDLTELFLFEAARAQIVSEVISPSLKKGRIVICDRFSDATLSYQGYGGKVPLEIIRTLDKVASGGLRPDLTILLDIDTAAGLRRAKKKGTDRMERKAVAYHERVKAGYMKLAALEPGRIKVIKVRENIEDTQEAIRREAIDVISRYKRTG